MVPLISKVSCLRRKANPPVANTDAVRQTCFGPSIIKYSPLYIHSQAHLKTPYQTGFGGIAVMRAGGSWEILRNQHPIRGLWVSWQYLFYNVGSTNSSNVWGKKDSNLVAECFCWSHQTASGNVKNGIITECILQLIIKLLNVLHVCLLV